MRVEIKLTRNETDTRESLKNELEELGRSYFPFAIISADEQATRKRQSEQSFEDYIKTVNAERSCSWTGTLDEFLDYLRIRESFGDNLSGLYFRAMRRRWIRQKTVKTQEVTS